MKALLLSQPKEVGIVEVPRQDDASKVVIKVRTVGVCGSDIAAYKGISPLVTYPRILGHEIAGEVVGVPAGATDFKVGDHVVTEPYMHCGKGCYPCSLGRTNCCDELKVMGVHADGGMVEYYSHASHLVHKVPESVKWEHLPVIEPLTIALHGLHRVGVKAGETVAITGAGAIGLLAAQAAAAMGARVIVIDPVAERLELAKTMGIEQVINPLERDTLKIIGDLTAGRMAEVVVEASGSAVAVRSALDYVSYAGRISLVGYPKDEVPLPTFLITKKELDIKGSRNSACQFPLAIELIASGKVQAAPIVSHIIEFAELPEYIAQMAQQPGAYLKVVAKL
ncbi:MAG: alcohol dehydrogenase catalytic domain-containing protein [Negativicutes bacterium]|nr:alcohol dehydrogenase catalytic domain-containing protein [Negativicutes bacterium]